MSVSTTSASPEITAAKEQELVAIFRARQTDLQNIANKLSELERDADEHALVIETLVDANEGDPDRKCFRLVGGVLVERTVKDVLPELQNTHSQLREVIEGLMKEYKKKDADFQEWQRVNKIVVRQR